MINKFSVATGGLFVALLWSNSSFAACNIISSSFQAQNVLMNIGEIIIDPNASVGTILRTGNFTINAVPSVGRCTNGGGSSNGRVLNGTLVPGVLNNVYTTNVPGIGVRLYRDSGEIQTFYPHTLSYGNTTLNLLGGRFKVDIVKTSQTVGTGPLSSGLYSTYYFDGNTSRPILTSTLDANGIIIVNPTCSYRDGSDNQTVTLDNVNAGEFSGIGSTAKAKEFSIKFSCNGGNRVDQKLHLKLNYTAANPAQGVIKNTEGAGYASGVGIQVRTTTASAEPVVSDSLVEVANVLRDQNTNPEIKLSAQYYQTEANVTAGRVSAMATLTMVYN